MTQRLEPPFFSRALMVGAAGIAALSLSACASTSIDDAFPMAPAAPTATAPVPMPAPATGTTAAATTAVAPAAAAAPVAAPVAAAGTETPLAGGAKDTGTYPNLNIPPQAANQQISDEEKTAEVEALTAAQKDHAAKAAKSDNGAADAVRLRKLAKTHATDALKAIEGQK